MKEEGKYGLTCPNIEISNVKLHTLDYTTFTHILASDKSNLSNLQYMKPDISTAEIRMWGSYLDGKPIGDPYYGGQVNIR